MRIRWSNLTVICCAALLSAFVTLPLVYGQTALIGPPAAPGATTTQQTNPSQPQTPGTLNPVARPIPRRTVGLEANKVVRWTLKDAILAALENNPDIELERVNVRRAQFDLFAAQGFYDPVATAGFSYLSQGIPNTRRNTGLGSSVPSITFNTLTYNFGYQQFYERTGGFYSADFNNQRSTSNQALLSPNYSPSLNFNITQPILRNYGIDTNRRLIKIQKKNLDLSDAVFRQRAVEIIARVQQAYWDLAFAIKDEEIQRESVKLAETQLNNNKRQVEVGTLAPIDVVSAATELESRRQQVFVAMNSVAQAENALKNLTVNGTSDELWSSLVVPVESFEVQTNTLPLPDAMRLAMDNRPELKQLLLQKEMNQVNVDFFRNQTKPRVDFVASYGTNGTGGNPAIAGNLTPNCANPTTINGQQFCQGVGIGTNPQGQPIPIVTQTPFVLSPFVSEAFVGGYGTALRNLFRNEFRTWTVGINIELPIRNRTAKANLGKSLEEGRQIELQNRRQMQSIEVEVRNAVQSVETAKMRIEAARAAREYARQQLDGEEKRFQAGLGTTFLVLTRQTQLSQAQGSELRALADFNKAVAELQRVISTTLSSNSIDVKPADPASIK